MIVETKLSSSARELMKAARSEGPSAAARATIWSGVASAGAAGASAVASSGSAAAHSGAAGVSGKLVAVGALFGSAVTVGLALVMVQLGPTSRPTSRPPPVAHHAVAARTSNILAAEEHIAPAAPAAPAPAPAGEARTPVTVAATPAKPIAPTVAAPVPRNTEAVRDVQEDTLMRESLLIAEARSALVRGNPMAALASIRATHALSSRALEPEELSIESRALRALGREDEAMSVDLRLKSRFPEHALAR